eukprot:234737-Pleurochrysis_carterae.AAC.1
MRLAAILPSAAMLYQHVGFRSCATCAPVVMGVAVQHIRLRSREPLSKSSRVACRFMTASEQARGGQTAELSALMPYSEFAGTMEALEQEAAGRKKETIMARLLACAMRLGTSQLQSCIALFTMQLEEGADEA